MSVSLMLQERLKQQLSSLRSELNGIFQQELNTMLEDMRRQLHDTTEHMLQSRQSVLRKITPRC